MNSQWTHIVIFICAALSGTLNYDGMANSFVSDADWTMKSLFAMTGIAVTLVMSLFWSYAFAVVPELSLGVARLRGWLTVMAGVVMIISLSTYWNVASLSKYEINRITGSSVVASVQVQLAGSIKQVNAFRSYVGDIASFHRDNVAIRDGEVGGGTSGASGNGPVSNIMTQVATRLNTLSQSVKNAEGQLDGLQTKASQCLSTLRQALSSSDETAAGKSLACVNQAISQMAGQDILSAMERGLKAMTSGIVLPATIKTQRQRDVIAGFLAQSKKRADNIAAQIATFERAPAPVPLTLERPNVLKGVLLHWQSLIAPLATALAIDLLPLIILLLKTLYGDDQRQRGNPKQIWTAGDLLDAINQMNQLRDRLDDNRPSKPDLPDYIDIDPLRDQPKLEDKQGEPNDDDQETDDGTVSDEPDKPDSGAK